MKFGKNARAGAGSNGSLPLRECGLKSHLIPNKYHLIPSLPLRECGLKSYILSTCLKRACGSLPLRECGLKFNMVDSALLSSEVTPFAGVWIEIRETLGRRKNGTVTPFAGVWIEIAKGQK